MKRVQKSVKWKLNTTPTHTQAGPLFKIPEVTAVTSALGIF